MASYKPESEWRLMKKIHHTAVSTTQILKDNFCIPTIRRPLSANQIATIPTLVLPFPDDIIAPVVTAQIPANFRQSILRHLTRAVNQMQHLYLKTYKEACLTSTLGLGTSLDMNALRHTCLALYKRHCFPIIESQVSSILTEITRVRPVPKRPFNNEYTPFLETYFEHNAYPSVRDRLVLAQKSMMTARQIEVWFQNHRNRAKKEGKVLKRFSSSLPLQLSLEALEKQMMRSRIPETNAMPEDSSDDSSADECASHTSQSTIKPIHVSNIEGFSNLTPPHAFPMRYPPNITSDPFPNENGIFKFPSPVWRRHPSTSQPQAISINMDEFTVMFAALNLEGGASNVQNNRKTHNFLSSPTPWFAARVTFLPPAPHPALMPPSLQSTCLPANSTASNLSSQNPSSCSRSVSPQTLCQKNSAPRKKAHLPRRTPSSISSFTTTRSRSTSSSSLSSADPITPLFSPSIQVQSAVVIKNAELESLNEYINTGLPHPFNHISSLNLDFSRSTMTKQIPSSAQYQINPRLALSTVNYVMAQS